MALAMTFYLKTIGLFSENWPVTPLAVKSWKPRSKTSTLPTGREEGNDGGSHSYILVSISCEGINLEH